MMTPVTWSGRPAKILWFVSLLELVLGAVFLVVGLNADKPVRSGFLLTAAILGGVGLLLMAWARRMAGGFRKAMRIKAQGIAGTATIASMTQTGMYLNNQPQVELQLDVTTPIQGPYRVVMKEWVPLIALGRLTGGVPLPVKVDPADPNGVVIEWEAPGAGAPGMGAPAMGVPAMGAPPDPGDREDIKKRLLDTGVTGRATVLKATKTGETDGEGRPVYDLMLRIEIAGYPQMQGPARVGVPPEHADQLEEGDSVPIKADPANPAMVAVDWDSA